MPRITLENLKRVIQTNESEEEEHPDVLPAYTGNEHCPKRMPKKLKRKNIEDMTKTELIELLKTKLPQHQVLIAKTLNEENVCGRVFKHLNLEDVKELFPSLKFGDRKLIIVIRDDLLAEENDASNQSIGQISNQSEQQVCEDTEIETKRHFRETFRKFDSNDKKSYRKGAVVSTTNTRISSLIEPIHKFLPAQDKQLQSTIKWIAEETIEFAAACLNERSNGTIHFGICGEKTVTYEEGQIIGIHIDKSACRDFLLRKIKRVFFKDQLEIAFKCIRPIHYIEVYEQDSKNQSLHIVEIDVVPSSELVKDEAFYIMKEHEIRHKKGDYIISLFKFENESSKVVRLSEDQVCRYMKNKNSLSEQRQRMERVPLKTEIKEDLRNKFLNLFTGGEEVLTHEIYPVLFLSPIDSSMTEDIIEKNFKFLVDIDANAIFDFDPSSDKRGMFNFIENQLEQVVKAYTTENFDRNSEENRNKKERYNSMLDDLRISSLKPWVFCNGYEAMDIEPLNTLEWKQKRSEGFKEAIRFFQDEIPDERAFVVFLLFSKNYEIMLEAADEVLVKFKNQWMIIASNEDVARGFMDELVHRKITNEKTLAERSVIGIPWQHVNKMVRDAVLALETEQCEIVTSNGAFCVLKEKAKNELYDLSVLSRKECNCSDITSDSLKREEHRRQVEEYFFKGGEVTWWNFWFRQDHVLKRSQHQKLLRIVRGALTGEDMDEDCKIGLVNLFHQPGSGGTTSAKQVLWDLKEEYRCCCIKQLSEDTCEQITTLRIYDDPEKPKPPLILIDNGDEEKIQALCMRLEDRAWVASKRNSVNVFCVLLLCRRRINLPKPDKRSILLKHDLDEAELEWFNRKYKALKKCYDDTTDGCDPRLLISFNILKENFNKDYIQNAVKEFVDGTESDDEQRLLKYLSLLNTYDPDFKAVPLSAFDPLMQCEMKNKTKSRTILQYGLVSSKQLPRQCWETRISPSLKILLNRTSRAGLGSQLKALSIINSLFAREILTYLQNKSSQSTSETLLELLDSVLFKVNNQSQNQLLYIVKDIMKKRVVQESGIKDKFSRLVTEILDIEDADRAAEILEKTFNMTGDAMVAQQLSRLYIHSRNWEKAVLYARKATGMKPQNSYLWDTLAQVYKRQLLEQYNDCVRSGEKMQNQTIESIIQLGLEGIKTFRKEQEISSLEKTSSPNDAGYFGELKIIILMFDLLALSPTISKDDLHRFLVDDHFTPNELNFLDQDTRINLKQLHSKTEHTMRILEDMKTQVKEDYISGIVQSKPRFKDNLAELTKIKENLDQYFGEDTNEIPPNMKNEDIPLFIRRRVRRLGGRTLPSILDIARNEGGSAKLMTMHDFIKRNVDSRFCDAYDLVTIIGVTLVVNIKLNGTFPYQNFIDWSKRVYDLVSLSDENLYLESFLYFVMFHWPVGNQNVGLCPTGKIVDAIKKWRIAFQKKHPRQDGKSVQKKETTYFFLGRGEGMDGIVYYEQLLDKHRGRYFIGDTVWRQPNVLSKLKRLTGTLITDGMEIQIQVETGCGNKTSVTIPTSMPIGKRSLWQKKVYFVLGFGWGGPKAYDVSQEDPTKQSVTEEDRIQTMVFQNQSNQSEKRRVKTHEELAIKLGEIDKELKRDLEKLQTTEEKLLKMKETLIQQRDEKVDVQTTEFFKNEYLCEMFDILKTILLLACG
ncbi:hypothetical protein KUTeg_019678 [Tegillarca granosa]|uniref:Sterile alpha motif domain-containing protein 9-like n=1 Tax=Tegillarca granosa TaxID=220873 RepID=A0ABQ9EI98_TEGGR|nr:hypothetical protein KUTeg_019678 [Tegillarca granosa]